MSDIYRDGREHHLLVIIKIKIRSSKNVILKIKDQVTQTLWSWRSRSNDDLDLQDHFPILKIKIVPITVDRMLQECKHSVVNEADFVINFLLKLAG